MPLTASSRTGASFHIAERHYKGVAFEEPLEAHGVAQRKGGEQVRLIGVHVPHPDDGGIFDLQPSATKRAQLAALGATSNTHAFADQLWTSYHADPT
jgi:hypothetical protein